MSKMDANPASDQATDVVRVPSPYEGKRLTIGEQLSISAYWFATNFLWGAMLTVMLPGEIARMAPAYKGPALGILLGLGAVAALVVPLIVGVMSDRCTSRFGRRRPFIAWGVAINVIGLALMCAAIVTAPTTLGGRVQTVDANHATIVAKSHQRGDLDIEKGQAVRFVASDRTKYVRGGEEVPRTTFFASIAPEDQIQARGTFDRSAKEIRADDLRVMKEGEDLGAGGLWVFLVSTPSFFILLAAFIVVQFGNNIASAAYSGFIPDLIPADQRGVASGYMGLMTQAGTLLGAVGCGLLLSHSPEFVKYALVAVVLSGVAMITIFGTKENRLMSAPPKLGWMTYLKSLWIDPREFPDFAWVWLTRAFVMLGFYLVLPYINFYLVDVIRIPQDEVGKKAAILTGVILIAASISGVYGGSLSDKIGRKRVVYFANSMIAVVTIAFIFCTSLPQVLAAGVLFGLGFGAYTSVDWALGTDVLPSKNDAAKEMAVWHIAMTAPQSLAAPLGAALISYFGTRKEVGIEEDVMHYTNNGYACLFVICAILFGLGAYFLKNVRGVK